MSIADRIDALGEKAVDLEKRAEDGDQRLLEEAAKAYGEATKLAEKHWGYLNEKTLTLRERWADSVRNTGNLTEATTCHLRNVEWTLENLKQHQAQHSSRELIALAQERYLYAQRQLAETYLASKRFSEAISLYEDILNSKANRSQEELYKDRVDLASALFESGSDRNIMRAVNLNIETLQKADQNLGRSHIETVKIRFNLAKELYTLEKYGDASEKYKELLGILEANECQARSAPEYHYYLQKTQKSLRTCSAKIDLQQEELRRAEKIRRELRNQVEAGKAVVRERKEASTSTNKTENKNQGEKPRNTELSRVQESQKLRVPDIPKQPKQASETTDRERTQEKPAKESRHQVAETSSRTEQQTKLSGFAKESSQHSNNRKKRDAVEGLDEHQSSAKQKADGTRAALATTPQLHLTDQSPRNSQKRTSKSESVFELPRAKDVSKYSMKTEAKRDLPIRPHSASETLSPHSTAESGLNKMKRSNSTRSDVSRTKRNSDHRGDSIVPKDFKLDGKSTWQKESIPSARSDSKPQREKMNSIPTTQPEKKYYRSASTPDAQSEDRKRESDVINWAANPSHSKEQQPNLETKKEKQSNRENSRNQEIFDQQKAPRISSAPSIVLSEPGYRKETQIQDSINLRPQSQNEKERPRSSKSHHREFPSAMDIVNQDIARRKERRSISSDSARLPLLPKIEHDLEDIPKHRSNAESSTSRNVLLMSGAGTGKRSSQFSEKSERKRTESRTGDLIEPQRKKFTEKLIPDSKLKPAEDKVQPPYLWEDAREYFESTNPENEDVDQQSSALKSSQIDSTASVVKPNQGKPLETVARPEPVHVISTGTFNPGRTEHVVPGGWHQDFDEPDLNQKVRKSRSNDALSQGGLRVSSPSGAGHRRAASVDIPRPTPTPKWGPHIRDWSYRDEIIADEWFESLQNKTHVFLDQYRDDCYGMTKAARRVRIAVLDTGVAKSTTRGPVPSLMKGPRVKIGKVLDSSLPWNIDTKGHGTHAAGLILTVCPYADVYVYRVCDGNSHIDKKHVADAILDAVDKKKVDIISMSLGWEDNNEDELEHALLHARANNVLIFAASSNDGLRTKAGMAFPARALEVIAIDAADVNGRPLGSNPAGTKQKGDRLTALGQAVRSTWPLDLPTEDPETGWKRLAGTSCATPIAAGIAGLVLEFARQRPMCFEQKIEKYLKKVQGMHLTLWHLLSTECDTAPRFRNLDSTLLFRGGGDWATQMSPRLHAASRIVEVLKNEYGDRIGLEMQLEIDNEMRRRHRQELS